MRAEIFLVSLAVILLEVAYTRIVSFKIVYYFTYLIIGVSMLGLGAGGVLVALRPDPRAPTRRRLAVASVAAGAVVLLGYVFVARVQLNAFDLVHAASAGTSGVLLREGAVLAGICLALLVPFLAAGLVVATILARDPRDVPRLYFADLLGAALGCAAAVPLMLHLSPPGTVLLAGLLFVASGALFAAPPRRRAALALLAPILALLGAVAGHRALPEIVPDRVKTMSPQQGWNVLYSRWSPVFRVDVLDGEKNRAPGLVLGHDGMWGAVLPRVDGDAAALARYDRDERALPFRVLAPAPRVAIVGAAGGNEIVAALHHGAAAVTAVELNPVTVSLLRREFARYTGDLARDPRVRLVNAEGRSFLATSTEPYDLVWFVAPDSYAAMNAATSGAYVLSESYLYTVEMVLESLRHLPDAGVVCVQFGEADFERKPNRTLRYLTTAREAFRRAGLEAFAEHVLVATTPGFGFTVSTILLRRTPFGPADVGAVADALAAIPGGRLRHPAPAGGEGLVSRVARLRDGELDAWQRTYPFDVRPVTDDAPFFWHFVPFRTALRGAGPQRPATLEEGTGERLLLVLLAIAVVLATVCLLAPLLAHRRRWRAIPHTARAAVYFAGLGLGFMFLEVTLIQRLTLFLGYPTYSLTVTLFALLLSTGLGSLWSERLAGARRPRLLGLAALLVLLVAVVHLGLPPLAAAGMGWPFGVRVAVAVAVIAPLGACLGVFMPLGLRTVAALTPHHREYVAWAWAVNGFTSVISSVLATVLAMTLGFEAVTLAALAIYLAAIAALATIPAPAA